MTGRINARVKQVTILGRMNDVNVQILMELDYDEGISGIDVIKTITAKWHAAGLEPPVAGSKQSFRTTAEKHGATGTHPDDLVPKLASDGGQLKCPNCGKPLYVISGITKKKDSPNYGQPWEKWYCPKARGGCGAYNFGERTDARFD